MKTQILKNDDALLNLYDDFKRYAINLVEYFFQNDYADTIEKFNQIEEEENQLNFISTHKKKEIKVIRVYHIGRHEEICSTLKKIRDTIYSINFLSRYLDKHHRLNMLKKYLETGEKEIPTIRSDLRSDNFVNVSFIFDEKFVNEYQHLFFQPELLYGLNLEIEEYKKLSMPYIYQIFVDINTVTFFETINGHNPEILYIYILLKMLLDESDVNKYGGIPTHTLTDNDIVYSLPFKK